MDDQFKDGFDRMLSDMGQPPTWVQVATPVNGDLIPAPWFRRPLAMAAATFVFTLVALGSAVLLGSRPSAPVGGEMVDYVKLEWSEEIDLVCEGLEIVDNGGFSSATIEIWGPDADGLLALKATAPDGTVHRQVIEHELGTGLTTRIWASGTSMGAIESEYRATYREASCSTSTARSGSEWAMSNVPIITLWLPYGAFIEIPREGRDGKPSNFIADTGGDDAYVGDRVWRGVSVEVYSSSHSFDDSFPGFTQRGFTERELWIDQMAGRLERSVWGSGGDILGRTTTTIEVVDRRRTPAGSVSFSTDGLELVRDWLFPEKADYSAVVTTTTVMANPDTPAYHVSLSWLNQTGLDQDDLNLWAMRLAMMCDSGYNPVPSSAPMRDLAEDFVDEDTDLSIRGDGSLPTTEEATEALWMSVNSDGACEPRWHSADEVAPDVDVAALNTAEEARAAIVEVRGFVQNATYTEYLDDIIKRNLTIVGSEDVSPAEAARRQAIIEDASEYEDARLQQAAVADALLAELQERYLELLGGAQPAAPVITLEGSTTIYSRTGDITVRGTVNQPAQLFVLGQEIQVHTDESGRSTFQGDVSLVGEGFHDLWLTASNAANEVSILELVVIVDSGFDVQFAYITSLSEGSPGVWSVEADCAEWLTGDEATAAAIEDGSIPEGGELEGDFYVRNSDTTLQQLNVLPQTNVLLQACWPNNSGSCLGLEALDLSRFESLLADPDSALDSHGWQWYGNGMLPYWLTIDDGVVVQIEEHYLP